MFSPMIFSTTATSSSASETVSWKVRSCARAEPRPPMMYAAIEALARSSPGK